MADQPTLAQAWIGLIPTLDGAAKNISDELGDTDVDKPAKKMGGKFKAALVAGAALAGAAVAKFLSGSIDAYKEAEESQAKLTAAFEKYPALASTNQAALQALNSALQAKTRFEDDSIAAAQASLAQFGLQGDQLERLTPLLLDYATATGQDVGAAAEALGRSLNGQTRALKAVGITYKSTGNQAEDFENITAALTEKVGGFAETAGSTAAGKADILRNKFGDLQELVGSKLVPVLTRVTEAGIKVVDWIQRNQGTAIALAAVIGTLTTAMVAASIAAKLMAAWTIAVTVATKVGAAAQWLMNAALYANPIGLIVAAVAALVAGLVLFFTKTEIGRKIWAGLVAGLKVGWNAIVAYFKFGWSIISKVMSTIWDAIKKVWGYSPLGLIVTNWDKIMAFFTGLPGKVKAIFEKVKDGIVNTFKSAFNFVAKLWNNSLGKIEFEIPSWVPGVGGKGWGFPKMPLLATGGTATRAGWSVVGENGPEFLRMPRGASVIPLDHPSAAGADGGAGFDYDRLAMLIIEGAQRIARGEVLSASHARAAVAGAGVL